ncbi:MAG: DUF1211 domain-containing protein [Actinobacteria bacterium]|nr:MAG: DUF1211 domain-containing protein [Actinomycetota bacterium]
MQSNSVGLIPTSRFDAFSDGVFAIAITLLVLELEVPQGGDDLLGELGHEWPSFLGYLVSFAFIGSVWIAHSTLGKFLRAADQLLVGLNLLLLLFVSLLPFTTSLMATHLSNRDGEHVAVVVFGLNLFMASLLINAMLRHAARSDDLMDGDDGPALKSFARSRRVSLIVQGGATVLGFFLPRVAVVIYLVISLLLLLGPIWGAMRQHRSGGRAASPAQ